MKKLTVRADTVRLLSGPMLRDVRGAGGETQTTTTTTQQDPKGVRETEPYSFCGMCVPITAHSFCRC